MQCKGCAETGAGCCSDGHPAPAILRPFVVGSEQLLIYILLDAAAIRQLIPERAWSVALPVYYLAAAAFVLLAIRGFSAEIRSSTADSPLCRRPDGAAIPGPI